MDLIKQANQLLKDYDATNYIHRIAFSSISADLGFVLNLNANKLRNNVKDYKGIDKETLIELESLSKQYRTIQDLEAMKEDQ
jgi:hypothetical protein